MNSRTGTSSVGEGDGRTWVPVTPIPTVRDAPRWSYSWRWNAANDHYCRLVTRIHGNRGEHGLKKDVPQAIPPAPMTTGISNGAPLLSVVVEVIVVDEVRSVYCEKVVGANFDSSAI